MWLTVDYHPASERLLETAFAEPRSLRVQSRHRHDHPIDSTSYMMPAEKTTIHVATDGNDAWSGTRAEPDADGSDGPFATLFRARDEARKRIGEGLQGPLSIQIHDGVYRLWKPLILDGRDGGTEEHEVTWMAAPGARPVISGGRRLRGWEKAEGELWAVELPEVSAGRWSFRNLYVAGRRRSRARAPKEGFYRIVEAGPDGRTSFTFAPQELQSFSRLEDVELVFFHDWSVSRVPIAAVDEESNTVQLRHAVGPDRYEFFHMTHWEEHPRYYVENALELLDQPGEWYLDRRQGRLYYWPLPGEDLERTEVVAPVLERLLQVCGEGPEKPVRNLRFSGLGFAHTDWALPERGYRGGQATMHEAVAPEGYMPRGERFVDAAVLFQGAESCTIERCRFAGLGGSGLWLDVGSHRNRVIGNEIVDVAGNGLLIGETYPTGYFAPLPYLVATKGNVVSNNLIHHCGQVFHGAVGIWAGITEGLVISRNELRDLPYTAISVGWIWGPHLSPCRDNRLEGNYIHHVMQVLSDGGGIYTLGRQPGMVIRRNLVCHLVSSIGKAESNGFFLDQGSSEILVESNVIYDVGQSPIRFNLTGRNLIRKNVLVPPSQREPLGFGRSGKTPGTEVVAEENVVIEDPATWTPPQPAELPAGREASFADGLLGSAAAQWVGGREG